MLNKKLNDLKKGYSFSDSTKQVNDYKQAHPDKEVLTLGIGDVSKPICAPVIEAMHKAVDDLASMEHFQGYGIYYGLKELREAVCENEYKQFGFNYDEIFISDGAKTDIGGMLEVFDKDSSVLIPSPLYPIYENTFKCLDRNYTVVELNDKCKFEIPNTRYDVIYMCSPSNPTGEALTYTEAKAWVDYANKNHSYLVIDNVYQRFIQSEDVPHSIYEIEGAKTCAIELRSFSKAASFTGLRCSYYVIPKELGIKEQWHERLVNRFNGASYVAQKAAIATYLPEAQKYIEENMEYYKNNANYLRSELTKLGFEIDGGNDSPYIWIKTRDNMTGVEYLDFLLDKFQIVMLPGEVFGDNKHVRASALGSFENIQKVIERLKTYYETK